jgi:hypothetical protein
MRDTPSDFGWGGAVGQTPALEAFQTEGAHRDVQPVARTEHGRGPRTAPATARTTVAVPTSVSSSRALG